MIYRLLWAVELAEADGLRVVQAAKIARPVKFELLSVDGPLGRARSYLVPIGQFPNGDPKNLATIVNLRFKTKK